MGRGQPESIRYLPKGGLWQSPSDWYKIFPGLFAKHLVSGLRFEGETEDCPFEIEKKRGRLHVGVQLGKPATGESTELLMIQLIARGPISEEEGWQLDGGLNLGHEVIVRSFIELSSEEAKKAWGWRG